MIEWASDPILSADNVGKVVWQWQPIAAAIPVKIAAVEGRYVRLVGERVVDGEYGPIYTEARRIQREADSARDAAEHTMRPRILPTREQIEEYIRCADGDLGPMCERAWVETVRVFLREWIPS